MKHILYIDDDTDDTMFFEQLAGTLLPDAKISTMQTGQYLPTDLANGNTPMPDILFLDLNVPVKSGFDILEELRLNEKTAALPVVILTTSSHKGDIDRLYDMGAHAFLTKPNDLNRFREILKGLFDNPAALLDRSRENFVLNGIIYRD